MEQQNKGFSLAGKKVVVLGGSSGIGLATAQAAAADGAEIVIVSGNRKRIDDALKQLPAGSIGHTANLAKEDEIKLLFDKIGQFDHLVFTAGENIQTGKLADTELANAKKFFEVRYWGAVSAVKYGAPFINEGGSIVLTGGAAGRRPHMGWSIPASICMAMEAFTRAMAVELAPIRVNVVVPGAVRTNLWNSMDETDRNNFYAAMEKALLVRHIGEAEEVAQTYLYLMKQTYSTGQTVVVDGGGVLI